MFAFERQERILAYLKENGKAEVSELSRELNVTEMTIRRDLSTLKEKNAIYRTHGGAVYKEPQILWQFASLSERLDKNVDEKTRIGTYVEKELIQDRDTLFIDAGSTTLAVAKLLSKERNGLLVVTNSDVIGTAFLTGDDKHKVILTGGMMEEGIRAQTGPITEMVLRSFRVGKAIIGTSSIIPGQGLFATNPYESSVKHLMIANARKTIVVADSSKLNLYALNCFCEFPAKVTIVTDTGISKGDEEKLLQQGIILVKV